MLTDIFQLLGGRSELVIAFLEGLLAGNLSLELPADVKTARWAFENQVESQNRTRLCGGHWLWFAFPILRIGEPKKQSLAPLWLWPLSLKAPADQDSGWVLQSAPNVAVRPNPKLDLLLRRQLGWQGEAAWWPSVSGQVPDMGRISTTIGELIARIGLESPSQSVSVSPWPNMDQEDVASGHTRLIWSGLIGYFPPAYPLPPGEVAGPIKLEMPLPYPPHSFGLLPRDPWQESVVQRAQQQKGMLIRGAGASGKSSLLLDLVINALSNGERCLILSSRLEALRELQTELQQLGLEKLLAFFQHSREEASVVQQQLKTRAREKKKTTFAANQYSQELERLLQQQTTLDQAFRSANKPILGPHTWTQTVGLYLAASRLESKALLASQLNAQDFNLSFEQYQSISEQLARSQALFEAVQTLSHPLTVLSAGIFVHQGKEEAQAFIQGKISDFAEQGAQLQYRYILEQNDYGDRLIEHYEKYYREILEKSSTLQDKIAQYRQHYGRDPLESTRTTLKLYGRFSDKFRKTLAAKEDLAGSYEGLIRLVQGSGFVQHDFLPITERHLLSKLSANVDQLQQQLYQWREQLGNAVQEELLRLSSKTVHTELYGHERIGELENELDLLVEGLNASGLLQLPLENKNLTLPRRQRFLEEIIEKLDRLRYNMRDFDRFFDWQRYWFGLPAETRRIITALVKVRPNDWSAAFSSWYLHHQLLLHADPDLPERIGDPASFTVALSQWRKHLIPEITDLWADRRLEAVQKLKKDNRGAYDLLMSKKEGEKDPGLQAFSGIISHFFPVTLATPYLDHAFLSAADQYDLLLVEEAQLLNPELLDIWKTRAKKTILFDNPQFGGQELLTWSRRQNWWSFQLQGDYRPADHKIEVDEVAGRYNARQKINDEEARRLLSLLNTVQENRQRTLPKVTIVCGTVAQRNLVVQYLDRIKRQRLAGVEKIQQLERNGLGVYTPDELYGLHTDLLFLSLTFGRTGAADQLSTDIQELNELLLPGLVDLLRSRARQATMILHSIPEEDLRRFAKDAATSNLGQLASWLLSLQSGTATDAVLQERPIHPLANEIAWQIADQVRTDRLAFQVPFGSASLPMTVAPLNGTSARAILLNGFLAETPATNYEWEAAQQQALQESGYQLHPVWSVAWWKRAGQEAAAFTAIVNAAVEEEE